MYREQRREQRPARRTRTAVGLLLSAGVGLAFALPGTAAADPPGPWQSYRSGPFTDAAGEVCSFPLSGHSVADQEKIRTLAVDSSGEPTEQEITGQLVFRYTDDATGAWTDENLTGTAWLYHHADGSQTWVVSGHLGLGIRAGNPYAAQGYSILGGSLTVQITADHYPYVTGHDGSTEDLCQELGRS
ncbi:hypothetical protein ABH940_004056 [Streptacidiphilus sp. BW17]|uniref:hypothetical protein n=1 Tax=Streptacidiphilus sp. BW17 TaxID=3156274 RepID=UPI003511E95B